MGEGRTFHQIPEHRVSHCHHCDQTATAQPQEGRVYSGSWLQGSPSIRHGNWGVSCLVAEARTGRSAHLGRPERRESANQNLKQISLSRPNPTHPLSCLSHSYNNFNDSVILLPKTVPPAGEHRLRHLGLGRRVSYPNHNKHREHCPGLIPALVHARLFVYLRIQQRVCICWVSSRCCINDWSALLDRL